MIWWYLLIGDYEVFKTIFYSKNIIKVLFLLMWMPYGISGKHNSSYNYWNMNIIVIKGKNNKNCEQIIVERKTQHIKTIHKKVKNNNKVVKNEVVDWLSVNNLCLN